MLCRRDIVSAPSLLLTPAAWAASLLAPLAAELGQARETIVGQAERLERQAETIGALNAHVANRDRELVRFTDETVGGA